MHDPTISFSIHEDKEKEMKEILTAVYDALRQKGYNPINQIVGIFCQKILPTLQPTIMLAALFAELTVMNYCKF